MEESDIRVFYNTSSRGRNDKSNRLREDILCAIGGGVHEYDHLVPKWRRWDPLVISYLTFIHSYCQSFCPEFIYDHRLYKTAGRKYNYDFELKIWNKKKDLIKTFQIEFKFNCSSIFKLPQVLQVRENLLINNNVPSYASFFFDFYIRHQFPHCSKQSYLKYVYQSNYDKLPIFRTMYDNEKQDQYQRSKRIAVKNSIAEYLKTYADRLFDAQRLTHTLKKTQSKLFMLYHKGSFVGEKFTEQQLTIRQSKPMLITHNSLLYETLCNTTYIHMLLRWKNHQGVLYPCWQISIRFNFHAQT